MAFTDIPPLAYYYAHGYKIMNPFCRILSATPQYRFILEWRNLQHAGERDARQKLADSVTIKVLMQMQRLDSKALDLLGIDEADMNSVIKGDGLETARLLKQEGVPGDLDLLASGIVKSARDRARERLGALWELLVQTRIALLAASPASVAMVIRGDTQGMIGYLATQGLTLPPLTVLPSVRTTDIHWSTNQFFSTSVGDELASLAGRALVWVIRLKPGTSGRTGGLYASEAEVLFPYDITLHFDGVVGLSSPGQVAGLDLSGFSRAESLRAKLKAVYEANAKSWPEGKVRILVASEV